MTNITHDPGATPVDPIAAGTTGAVTTTAAAPPDATTGATVSTPASTAGSVVYADQLNQSGISVAATLQAADGMSQGKPADAGGGAVAGTTATGAKAIADDPESLKLLRNIDTNVTSLSERIEVVEKAAIRSGATAGAIAGALSGGIIATGIAFARSKLGF